ncbi:hypothetical protein NF552_06965 [Roseomonas mucosa]|nr:hypothetical protein NF552_06965 [Roseomonas mucosa]
MYKNLKIDELLVNPSNDRHGQLGSENAAISMLFQIRDTHMRNLAKDIVSSGGLFEPPLVRQIEGKYIVYDGNRRVTCIKLLRNPTLAPTTELDEFFRSLRINWPGNFPEAILCRVENNENRVNDIIFRRHTGVQQGIGQSTWDDRMKDNFVRRTGRKLGLNISDEIEGMLIAIGEGFPAKKIPRSVMNRLFAAETMRNRVGFSVRGEKVEFISDENLVLKRLRRIAQDMVSKHVTLKHVWDAKGKNDYLDAVENCEDFPQKEAKNFREVEAIKHITEGRSANKLIIPAGQYVRKTLIPQSEYSINWVGHLERHRRIWHELQFELKLPQHVNAISVLFRVLLEISVENYVKICQLDSVYENDKLSKKIEKISAHLFACGMVSKKESVTHLISFADMKG